MMDIEKFEREELPWIKIHFGQKGGPKPSGRLFDLMLAFEQAMATLRKEREKVKWLRERDNFKGGRGD